MDILNTFEAKPMAKIIIIKDEWYPVYEIYKNYLPESNTEKEHEVSEDLIKRFENALKEFMIVQHILSDICAGYSTPFNASKETKDQIE